MNWLLQINGKQYSSKNLLDITDAEIRSFLEEWGNDSPTIAVKTSGSTGKPKLIYLLKSDMVASAELTGKFFNLQKGQTALLCLPVKYIAGKMMLIRAIVLGLKLISIKPSSNPLVDCIDIIDFAAMTPMQVKTVLNQSPQKLDLIKQLIIGGAPVDAKLESKLQDVKAICYSTYGMTETITHVAIKRLNGENKSESFEALPNITFQLRENDCLIINAPHLKTSRITTNDIVHLIDNKSFNYIGRIDNVINSGGVKLQPEIIEYKLNSLLIDHRFFISSLPDKHLGEQVVLVIESKNQINDLLSHLKKLLNQYELPKIIYLAHSFIETETGKVNRKKTLNNVVSNPSNLQS